MPHRFVFFISALISVLVVSSSEASGVVTRQEAIKQRAQERRGAAQIQAYPVNRAHPFGQRHPEFEKIYSEVSRTQQQDEVVEMTLAHVWNEFERSSELWERMMDRGPKELTVQKYVDWYREQDVHIRKPPSHYVTLIDQIAEEDPSILHNAFHNVIKYVAIVEYDFDNGQDKDELARRFLGEAMYLQNRKRLGKY